MPFPLVALIAAAVLAGGCTPPSPTAATPIAAGREARRTGDRPTAAGAGRAAPLPGTAGPSAIAFPPRDQPLLFRTALESKYQHGLGRSTVDTYVDQEGTVVWTQEYLRYRVNRCSHADATSRVLAQIAGQGIAPVCGDAAFPVFPPRNEPYEFMQQLEATYRNTLGRPTQSSYVDVEGNIVWTQEYVRYRITGCDHVDAQQKVFDQIDGHGVPPDCTPCRYCPTPVEQAMPCTSGASSFEVRPVSADIEWTAAAEITFGGFVEITSGASGRGRGTVNFRVSRPAYGCPLQLFITVGGLSGQFPRELHTIFQR